MCAKRNSVITQEIAKEKLLMWLEAEEAVATGQSYTIGRRSLTRVNLAEIRRSIEYWEGRLEALEHSILHEQRAVPLDI